MNMHIKSHETVEIYDKYNQKSMKTYSIPLTLVVSEDGIIIESDECAGKFPDCFNSNKDNNHISRLVPFLTKRSGPHFLDRCLRSYFLNNQPAFGSLMDS